MVSTLTLTGDLTHTHDQLIIWCQLSSKPSAGARRRGAAAPRTSSIYIYIYRYISCTILHCYILNHAEVLLCLAACIDDGDGRCRFTGNLFLWE